MRKYITEFIGTFFLVFTVCCASLSPQPLAAVGIGVVLAAMIFAGGHISGAHFNPAVTLAVFVRGKLDARDVGPYIAAQLLAGAAAAGVSRYVISAKPAALSLTGRPLVAAVIVELLFTFALAYVVLNVATSKDHPNNSFYGLAIGFTLMAGVIAVGGVSGGAFNPAVGLGVTLAGLASWSMIWVYLIVTLVGGAIAGFVFRALNPDDVDAPVGAPAASASKQTVPTRRRPS